MDLVRSELTGLAALRRDTDLVVPEPVRTRNGDLLTDTDPAWDGGVVRAVIERARAARDALRPEDFGLQHADLHQEN